MKGRIAGQDVEDGSAPVIVTCGEAIVDLLPERQSGELIYRPVLGGSLYNVAVGIARLGGRAGYLWELSSDELGQALLGNLEAIGVDVSAVRIAHRPCPVAVVDLSGPEPTYAIADPGRVMVDTVPPALPDGITCLHVGSAVLANEPVSSAIFQCAAAAPFLSIDFNVRPPSVTDWARYSDRLKAFSGMAGIVKASAADAAALQIEDPHAFMRRLVENGVALAVLTAAQAGAWAYTPSGEAFAPTQADHIVDTVGAGDAFMCGALAHLQRESRMTREAIAALSSETLLTMLETAQRAAAFACGQRGAVMPTAADMFAGPH